MTQRAAPELATDRLLLRQWREDDFAGVAAIFAHPSSSGIGGPLSEDLSWRFMATMIGHWHLRGFGLYALEDKSNGAFAGWCGLWSPHGWPEPEVGWSLHPEARGRGFAVEAAERVRRHAYADLGWPTIISFIADDNIASQNVAKRLGAEFETMLTLRGKPAGVWRHPPPSEVLS